MNLATSSTREVVAARSLRRGVAVYLGAGTVLFLAAIMAAGWWYLRGSVRADADRRILDRARQSEIVVRRLLDERARQVDMIAVNQTVIETARRGGAMSRRLGLRIDDEGAIEKRFDDDRSLNVDHGTTGRFLSKLEMPLLIEEIILTDDLGFNAVVTRKPSDFIQSDEGWWRQARDSNVSRPVAAWMVIDATDSTIVAEQAQAVHDTDFAGVVKVKFALEPVDSALSEGGDRSSLRVDLLQTDTLIASSVADFGRMKPFHGALGRADTGLVTFDRGGIGTRGAVIRISGSNWRVVAHQPLDDAYAGFNNALILLALSVLSIGAVLVAVLWWFDRYVNTRITMPAAELAAAAEAVAAGDLSTRIAHSSANDEIGRLSRGVATMIEELRRLVGALNESALDTSTMAGEITASSEEMAASASQIAHTAGDLSAQSSVMAETITALASASEDLVRVSTSLGAGAKEGVHRNTQLRQLSLQNRARLDQGTRALESLSADAESSRTSIEALASASEEVRSFVTLVQKLARQSKLLALNAAMEAARAGEHGQGFAVVAEEVRRLAAMSSDAAERTERVVHGVLQGIAQSRASTERMVDTVREVRGATEDGSRSFGEIETAVAGAEQWTTSINHAAEATGGLVRNVREKLDTLASGTESFAAAMQEVAASSEEQSASTEQIAASASTLASAADRLTRLVSNLRLDLTTEFSVSQAAAASAATSRRSHPGEPPLPSGRGPRRLTPPPAKTLSGR